MAIGDLLNTKWRWLRLQDLNRNPKRQLNQACHSFEWQPICISVEVNKLEEALIKYDRLLACRRSWATMLDKPRQANSLSYLIRASLNRSYSSSRCSISFGGFPRWQESTG